jgi:HAE1 family hydrophobic/amphiphilic exporter-1
MTLSELCIRRPVMTTLITASIIAFGIFGFRLLPVSALPRVDFPTIAVTATLPGASADTMAASVAGVIERQLSTIAGISSMSSNSSQGTSVITIQFDLNRSIDAAALDVQTALTIAQRRLPIEMKIPPSFRKVNPAEFPVLFVVLGSPRSAFTARRNSPFASRPTRKPPRRAACRSTISGMRFRRPTPRRRWVR